LLERAEYKRRQSAPGVKVSARAFGRERRYPITNGYRADMIARTEVEGFDTPTNASTAAE
jgi:hypothetical protein